jgi:hypothetical protein
MFSFSAADRAGHFPFRAAPSPSSVHFSRHFSMTLIFHFLRFSERLSAIVRHFFDVRPPAIIFSFARLRHSVLTVDMASSLAISLDTSSSTAIFTCDISMHFHFSADAAFAHQPSASSLLSADDISIFFFISSLSFLARCRPPSHPPFHFLPYFVVQACMIELSFSFIGLRFPCLLQMSAREALLDTVTLPASFAADPCAIVVSFSWRHRLILLCGAAIFRSSTFLRRPIIPSALPFSPLQLSARPFSDTPHL